MDDPVVTAAVAFFPSMLPWTMHHQRESRSDQAKTSEPRASPPLPTLPGLAVTKIPKIHLPALQWMDGGGPSSRCLERGSSFSGPARHTQPPAIVRRVGEAARRPKLLLNRAVRISSSAVSVLWWPSIRRRRTGGSAKSRSIMTLAVLIKLCSLATTASPVGPHLSQSFKARPRFFSKPTNNSVSSSPSLNTYRVKPQAQTDGTDSGPQPKPHLVPIVPICTHPHPSALDPRPPTSVPHLLTPETPHIRWPIWVRIRPALYRRVSSWLPCN